MFCLLQYQGLSQLLGDAGTHCLESVAVRVWCQEEMIVRPMSNESGPVIPWQRESMPVLLSRDSVTMSNSQQMLVAWTAGKCLDFRRPETPGREVTSQVDGCLPPVSHSNHP